MAYNMAVPGGKTLRTNMMTRLILLGMVPLCATGKIQGVLGREEVDGRLFLRKESGRNLQAESGFECGGAGFPGVRSSEGTGKICCAEECGTCGGSGCAGFATEHNMTASHCCTTEIRDLGVMCSDTMEAPCIIAHLSTHDEPEPETQAVQLADYELVRCSEMETADGGETAFFYTKQDENLMLSTCSDECAEQAALYFAVLEGDVCGCGDSEEFLSADDRPVGECDMACPGNAAEICGGRTSYVLYEIFAGEPGSSDDGESGTGSGSASGSASAGETGDDGSDGESGGDGDLPTCSTGITGVESESGDVCCDYKCVTCGGDKCRGNGDCCEHTIQLKHGLCSDTGTAPCVYNEADIDTPAPVAIPEVEPRETRYCSNGLPGVESDDGITCCLEACVGCSEKDEECVGASACCAQFIKEQEIYCQDEGVEAGPCIM